jgi:hypothetical protein
MLEWNINAAGQQLEVDLVIMDCDGIIFDSNSLKTGKNQAVLQAAPFSAPIAECVCFVVAHSFPPLSGRHIYCSKKTSAVDSRCLRVMCDGT